MNIIIDGKYAPCMQACVPPTGGSEQRSSPPARHTRSLYSEAPAASECSVFPRLKNGTPAKEGDVQVDNKPTVNSLPLGLSTPQQSWAARCLHCRWAPLTWKQKHTW